MAGTDGVPPEEAMVQMAIGYWMLNQSAKNNVCRITVMGDLPSLRQSS